MTLLQGNAEAQLDRFADGFSRQHRAPVLSTPADHGLAYEEVTFPSYDGVPLEGWFIPASGSKRVIIVNHPMGFSRSGLPADQEPWRSTWAASGNDFAVDFLPDYRILHDAGYHVLTYDLRSHGLSGTGNGGLSSSGIHEARDVLGSLAYIRGRRDLQDATFGLLSRCLGASSTFAAMTQLPATFADVRCLLALQPVTAKVILERRLEAMGLGSRIGDLERRIVLRTGIGFNRRAPQSWARNVRVPTYICQVREDTLTTPEDVQAMFNNIPIADKTLHWIEGTKARFDGYLELQRRPEALLTWLDKHMP